jgi:outer membrane scaffolding protein for murein synthesis (MipA/OmpV family)
MNDRHLRPRAGSRQGVLATGITAALLLAGLPAGASDEVAQIPFYDAPPGSTALGAGLRLGQDLYRATDNDEERTTDLVPLYLYNGKYLFARGTSGGIHLYDSDRLQLNALARYRFSQLKPSRNEYYEGLEEREQTVEAGVEALWRTDWGRLKLQWLTDTLDRHNGDFMSVSYRYNWDFGNFSFSPFISWTWEDADLTNYYYGVSESEARADRPAYTPGKSEWLRFGLNSTWWLNDRISLFANVGFGGPDNAVTDSPLVEEDSGSAVFIGGSYAFGNVYSQSSTVSEDRRGLWSWRVNYGYQAQGNIVGEVNHGDFSKSKVADTNIAGLTLSKLVGDGPRVDFYGRFALFRHLEEDEGNGNFNSYAAYIMAVGKGYSPWSGNEVFRWGFGFGMSYADRVPIAEQRKQAKKGNNTSHFLNYLEMTVDFPLRRLFESKMLSNCYAGLTIVHRSGIFNTSDFLGDVGGGSDWLTAHLECMR